MSILKIKSPYVLQQLFSFILEKRKFKIIRYNSFMNKKLDLSLNDYKELFFKKKIEKYNYIYINDFWINFKNDLDEIIEEKSYDLFLNVLSKKEDFNLRLNDNDFNLIIKNSYFKENSHFELNLNYDELPRLLLIKDNKLTNKTIKTLKEIFDLFSIDGKMSKEQSLQFLHKINKDNNINKLFSYDIDNKGYLLFENFINYYYDLTKDNSNYLWNDLKKLGYNKLLDKNKEYDLEYLKNNLNEFEELNFPLNNFLKIMNMKINKLCLLSEINKIFIDYLNKNKIIADLKILEISIINLKLFIDLNIICPNIKELNLYSLKNNKDEDNSKNSNKNNIEINQKEIINIFPEISILKIYFIQNCNLDLIDLISNLMKIENIEIYYKCDFNSKINSKIILNNIKRLKIDCNNEIFMKIFNNINFPNLEYYEINIKEKININEKITVNDKLDEDDYNLFNRLLNKK